MLIYLIGYMGCGKTTLGKRLAKRLGFDFVDLDEKIETQTGKTIRELFEIDGEEAFRLMEKEVLQQTFQLNDVVISTGGGVPVFFDNMEQINTHGTSIYIKLSPKSLVNRLQNGKNQRPLIKDKTDEELLLFIEKALEQREPFYEKANLIVDGLSLNSELIMEALRL